MARVLDVQQALLLLELEAPFEQRDVQLARRRMAKRWHPDIAPHGRAHEHQRHLQAINEAADQLESLAESSRGGRVSAGAVRASAAAARRRRAEEGRRAYEAE
jgi:DnaJ-class molecular chaperone